MTKFQKILAGLLAFQIVLIAIVFLTNRSAIASNNPLLPDFTVETVTGLTITNNSGSQIKMEKIGDEWVLPEKDNYPVEGQNVSDLLDEIALIRDNRLVTTTSASHKRLQVADTEFQGKLEITTSSGTSILYVGSSPAANSTHIRLASSDSVYLTNAISASRVDPAYTNWINTSLVQIAAANVSNIAVTTANGSFHFSKDENSNWTSPELSGDESIDASKWSSLLSGFTSIRLVEPVSKTSQPTYGLENPTASLVLNYLDENNATQQGELIFGNMDESGSNYYAKWSQSPYVVLVSSYNADRIINLSKADFLPTPATATAAP